jgi:hypothetical protein
LAYDPDDAEGPMLRVAYFHPQRASARSKPGVELLEAAEAPFARIEPNAPSAACYSALFKAGRHETTWITGPDVAVHLAGPCLWVDAFWWRAVQSTR